MKNRCYEDICTFSELDNAICTYIISNNNVLCIDYIILKNDFGIFVEKEKT